MELAVPACKWVVIEFRDLLTKVIYTYDVYLCFWHKKLFLIAIDLKGLKDINQVNPIVHEDSIRYKTCDL